MAKKKAVASSGLDASLDVANRYKLLPGYHFRVDFCINNKYIKDVAFKSVGGLKIGLTFTPKEVGAESVDQELLIKGGEYSDLVLERGVTVDSNLYYWLTTQIETKKKTKIPVVVTVLDFKHDPVFCWFFINAYPVSWETSGFDAMENKILMEKITLKFDFFKRVQMTGKKLVDMKQKLDNILSVAANR